MTLPAWLPAGGGFDSWQTSAWERLATRKVTDAAVTARPDEHF
jgi:hypothetical protein